MPPAWTKGQWSGGYSIIVPGEHSHIPLTLRLSLLVHRTFPLTEGEVLKRMVDGSIGTASSGVVNMSNEGILFAMSNIFFY